MPSDCRTGSEERAAGIEKGGDSRSFSSGETFVFDRARSGCPDDDIVIAERDFIFSNSFAAAGVEMPAGGVEGAAVLDDVVEGVDGSGDDSIDGAAVSVVSGRAVIAVGRGLADI